MLVNVSLNEFASTYYQYADVFFASMAVEFHSSYLPVLSS
jgi:hypothetical protein